MNIYQKLVEVRKLVDFLKKDTQGYQYRYVSGVSVLSTIRPKMDELGLLLVTDIVEANQKANFEVKDKQGSHFEQVVEFKTKMTWINAENPEERLSLNWIAYGQDVDISKADGKALTYAERYFLLKFFNIPTDDEDPDAQQKRQMQTVSQPQSKSLPKPNIQDDIAEARNKVKTLAIQYFGEKDKFTAWAIDMGYPDKLENYTVVQLQAVSQMLVNSMGKKK